MTKGTASASCVGNPGSDGLSPLKIGPSTNHFSWNDGNQPDWLVIRPNYTSAAGAELRSRIGLVLRTQRSPFSPVYTFPLTEDLGGGHSQGSPNHNRQLTASGTVLSFSNIASAFAVGANVESLFPNLVNVYQTDNVTGPSEKPLVNLKLLRNFGFDLVDITFSMFHINTNFNISEVPVELALYKGGAPVKTGNDNVSTDWSFPGGTEVAREVLYTRKVRSVTTEATRDPLVFFNLSFAQKTLIFYPLT